VIPLRLRTKTALAAIAIAGGAVLATGSLATPAVAFFSPPLLLQISVQSPATLVARGAGANVTLKVECAGTRTAFAEVVLTERVGKQIAQGFGSTEIGCTGQTQTVLIEVVAQPGKAFAKGSAIADGFISACSFGQHVVCGSEEDTPTIKLIN
jgi:hypothetical protein